MALAPRDYTTNERLQPGARGEIFKADQPGYRDGADRVNRTNNFLNTSEHDVPNIKYLFDYRLPVLFKYGFAHGFNQIVIPKGRIVATDPNMDLVDFESQKQFNTVTLANGGAPVRLREVGDKYPEFGDNPDKAIVSAAAQGKQVLHVGKEWTPLAGGIAGTYSDTCYRPFAKAGASGTAEFSAPADQLAEAGYEVDPQTGLVAQNGVAVKNVRVGNHPIGMLERNEYTRDDDAFNGIMPGPFLTDALVEMPWFAYKDKAEQNLWGSAYGALFPGARIKSDENGRFTLSPLSFPKIVATMSLAEYEMERQQEIGQVYSVNHELVPEGAAKWATWALEDRLKSDEFNPAVYAKTNRRGEDAVNTSPFNSTGKYPGYPYEKNYLNHDPHRLASTARLDTFDPRMNPEYQYSDLGIPGLTDGYNAVKLQKPDFKAGTIHYAGGKDYVDMFFKNLDVNVEDLQISVNGTAKTNCVEGALLCDGAFVVKYANAEQGYVVIAVADKEKADALLRDKAEGVDVVLSYAKRGMAGVPTFMDWDGCIGSVKILLNK
jgi:hypothetical protein